MTKFVAALLCVALSGCAGSRGADWIVLLDGAEGMINFRTVGDADWKPIDQAIQATSGSAPSYLVTHRSYADFILRVEFWASADANSGVFLRCEDPDKPTDASCHKMTFQAQADKDWNTLQITAHGNSLTIMLNGKVAGSAIDSRHVSGRIALQHAGGVIKFRKIEIKPL